MDPHLIHFINIDEVANFNIRKYSENLTLFNFSLARFDAERKLHFTLSSFSQGRILKRSEFSLNIFYCLINVQLDWKHMHANSTDLRGSLPIF